jgi:hypothetical protein
MVLTTLANAGNYQRRTKDPTTGQIIKNPSGGELKSNQIEAPYANETYGGGYGGGIGQAETGTGATCSGTITTIYDWVPSRIPNPDPSALTDEDPTKDSVPDPLDLPPDVVIAKETCTASYESEVYGPTGTPDGACANGLGFTEVTDSGDIWYVIS